ncbi:unnamed protein product [Bursaphelenchus xylophilus]|uniref:(pine wood nematode) hypothetical protein n=1 Tax=Bursaphelenchus xylophilus TaxID=6326 RepID=A0A1I7SCV9_BURXY|nr:unnamed protein product [Bursaphelenchus xylophilus]CAG9093384.1 unnamed protein product [Bursaphelenchus xylophilus]
MKVAVLLFMLVVAAAAIEKKKSITIPFPFHANRAKLINKLKLIVDDAGVHVSHRNVAKITDKIRNGLANIKAIHKLPSLVGLVNDLESSILALPDTNPRGPAFQAVVKKADELHAVLFTVLNDVKRIPYDLEKLNLHLLEKSEENDQIRKNLKSLKLNFGLTFLQLNHFYRRGALKRINIHLEVQELVDLLSRPSVSKQQYSAAIKKILKKLGRIEPLPTKEPVKKNTDVPFITFDPVHIFTKGPIHIRTKNPHQKITKKPRED